MPPRPLIIFGLRGTLLERLHAARVPAGMPPVTYPLGMHQLWLRPHCVDVISQLIGLGCDVGIWSSTTTRNTFPVLQTVFGNFPKVQSPHQPEQATKAMTTIYPFKFIWTREQTVADVFRRSAPQDAEDENATLKDLSLLFEQFAAPPGTGVAAENSQASPAATEKASGKGKKTSSSTKSAGKGAASKKGGKKGADASPPQAVLKPNSDYVYTPDRTVIVDDTCSKCRLNAENFLWVETFGAGSSGVSTNVAERMQKDAELLKLVPLVRDKVIPSADVRSILPLRL